MKKVSHEFVVPVPIEKVVEAYKDVRFYVEKLKNSGAITVEILEREEMADGRIRTKARVTEPSRVPAFLRKSELEEYVDENVFDPKERVLSWRITPTHGADKVFLSGRVEFGPDGNSTRIVFHTELEIKIPLVGGQAEKIALADTEKECARQAEFIARWASTS